jgi:BirA family biotin operon repressor/biotin-[acetyl-CoA-carboxylase] ligase
LTRIRFVERTGSTNSDLLADHHAPEGDWLIAARQEQGRGRQNRVWKSPAGNYHGSTLVRLGSTDPQAGTLALAAGLALIRAVEAAAPATGLILKWPNDLLLGSAKLAGILLERQEDRVVAGFGVNLAQAPHVEGRDTVALSSVALVSPEAFAPLLAAAFARELQRWREDPLGLCALWLESAHAVGTPLSVHVAADEKLDGTFAGLAPDGALRLALPSGEERRIHAADVTLGSA